jgi:hypothetical protein
VYNDVWKFDLVKKKWSKAGKGDSVQPYSVHHASTLIDKTKWALVGGRNAYHVSHSMVHALN